MNKMLLIGGRGFIGKAMGTRLNQKGIYVDVLDKNDLDLEEKRSSEILRQKISQKNYENIIILAAIKRQDGDGKIFFERNNAITENICKGIEGTKGKVIYFSSCAVYGEENEQTNFTEESKIEPTSYYGEHKAWSEIEYCKIMNKDKLLIIRPPLIYSKEDKQGYNPSGFYWIAKISGKIKIWGDGSEKREFIEMKDATNATIDLIEKKANGIVNLTCGKSYSYREIVEEIRKHVKCETEKRGRTKPQVDHTYNNNKLKSWIPNVKFKSPIEVIQQMAVEE